VKKPKEKKRRTAVKLGPQPGWNLGRHIRVKIARGVPVPRFLAQMIVKQTDHKGGSQ
jgi:hypothetical protein